MAALVRMLKILECDASGGRLHQKDLCTNRKQQHAGKWHHSSWDFFLSKPLQIATAHSEINSSGTLLTDQTVNESLIWCQIQPSCQSRLNILGNIRSSMLILGICSWILIIPISTLRRQNILIYVYVYLSTDPEQLKHNFSKFCHLSCIL